MKYKERHPKEIANKVHKIESYHKKFLRRTIKSKVELREEYIYNSILSGIKIKKNDIAKLQPTEFRFLENLYLRVRSSYYSILKQYRKDHIKKLEIELQEIKNLLLPKIEGIEIDNKTRLKMPSFVRKFSIRQALIFIARDIAYEKMAIDPFFDFYQRKEATKSHVNTESMKTDTNGDELAIVDSNCSSQFATTLVEDAMLTAQEAAELTGYSINTIRQKTSQEKIPFHKLPNSSSVRYSKLELHEWMKGRKNEDSLLNNIANTLRKKKG